MCFVPLQIATTQSLASQGEQNKRSERVHAYGLNKSTGSVFDEHLNECDMERRRLAGYW